MLVSSSPGPGDRAAEHLPGLHDDAHDPGRDRARTGWSASATGPPCYGEGKLYWAERWAEEHGIAMDEAVAYADNWSDRALLERVGRAVVVHPHGRLLRLARERGWDVVRPGAARRQRRARAPGAIEADVRKSTSTAKIWRNPRSDLRTPVDFRRGSARQLSVR